MQITRKQKRLKISENDFLQLIRKKRQKTAAYTKKEAENCNLYGKRDEKRRFMAKKRVI